MLGASRITLKIIFLNAFSRNIIVFYFFKKLIIFFHNISRWKVQELKKTKKLEDNIIKDVKNIFRLKKEIDYTTIKDVRNLFRLKKKKKNRWHHNESYEKSF